MPGSCRVTHGPKASKIPAWIDTLMTATTPCAAPSRDSAQQISPGMVGDGVLKMGIGREIEVWQARVIGRVKGEAESRAQENSGRTTSIPSLQNSSGCLSLQVAGRDGQILMQICPVLEIFLL